MADVYLFYALGNPKFALDKDDYKNSAYHEWLTEFRKAMSVQNSGVGESQQCSAWLRSYHSALEKTLDWSLANKKEWQVIIGQADEEGRFSISVSDPGEYYVLVLGHAGFNNAVWESKELVTISPGKEITTKMSSPEKACVEVGD